MDSDPPLRFVTASLKIDYRAPTPMGEELLLRGQIVEVGEGKVTEDTSLEVAAKKCAQGRVIAVRIPDNMLP